MLAVGFDEILRVRERHALGGATQTQDLVALMSRLEVPLLGRALWATGDVLVRAEIVFLLKNRIASEATGLSVDSGGELTTMPALEAKQLGLPVPQQAARGAVHTQTGLEIAPATCAFGSWGWTPLNTCCPACFLGNPDAPARPRVGQAFPAGSGIGRRRGESSASRSTARPSRGQCTAF